MPSTRSAATRSPTCSPAPGTAGPWQPAGWPRAWTCPGRWRVDSVMAPMAARVDAWARLARDLDPATLDTITETRPIADAPAVAEDILAGKVRGRVVLTVT